ncbi:hypothetical protein HanXRQr2_Chr08g0329131 [Helianthus annuus]|uniref:Uncharacterized protein n=1 Tax=Helianthus annuus TaxID=4232 RepID=A0A9K3ID54_HELAN|nr:hypothetical protein HanXRQr2_Chr08g0329131 [Helianthus annuus]KAJ0900830.1 hypothetical protein HanPSC8_Chr08g0318211 [Helianthus annuus]
MLSSLPLSLTVQVYLKTESYYFLYSTGGRHTVMEPTQTFIHRRVSPTIVSPPSEPFLLLYNPHTTRITAGHVSPI